MIKTNALDDEVNERSLLLISSPPEQSSARSLSQEEYKKRKLETLFWSFPISSYGSCLNGILGHGGDGRISTNLLASLFPAMLIVWMIQSLTLFKIWTSLSDIGDSTFCHTSSSFQLAVVGMFFLGMTDSVTDLFKELMAILSAKMFVYDSGEDQDRLTLYDVDRSCVRLLIAIVVWTMELSVEMATFTVGTKFIVVQDDASDLVMAVLSLVFIKQLDNTIFAAVYFTKFQTILANMRFELALLSEEADGKEPSATWPSGTIDIMWTTTQIAWNYYLVIPFVIFATGVNVYYLRYVYCDSVM